MVRDAFYFFIPLVGAAAGAFWAGWDLAAAVLLGLTLFVAFFFRDPEREIPSDPGIIVSPADGRVVRIEKDGAGIHVSIFLSIFNVHVNRSPIAGRITDVHYRKGKFRAAFKQAANLENEQNTLTIDGDGLTLVLSQIAGLVARRIVCWKKSGDTLGRGERIGLIRFGSRADLILPNEVELRVQVGDKVRGGSSVIGILKETNVSKAIA